MFGRVASALDFRSEDEFVMWLKRWAATPDHRLKLGIGDDAALVSVAKSTELILTSDLSIEGVHFRRDLHPPRSVGHRALARSLSDIAAMGGRPRFALISLAISRDVSPSWIRGFYAGMSRLARSLGVAIVGGDTAVVPGRITVDVVVVGEVQKGHALRRAGARPGDRIFVSGRLGLSALGLHLLESGSKSRAGWVRAALQSHLWPQPQCALGRFLSERRLATALIDISDGLSTDLARLCQASGVGARLWEDKIPMPVMARLRQAHQLDPLRLALDGGEDYQLLFSVPPHLASRIPKKHRGLPLHCTGEIQKSRRISLVRGSGQQELLAPGGYDHFREP